MTSREERERAQRSRREQTCVHFTGTANERCAKGISYAVLGDDSRPGMALRLPCYPKLPLQTETPNECLVFEAMGRDRVIQEDVDRKAAMQRAMKARKAIVEKEGKARNVHGSVPCPNCDGTVRYEIHYNGHIHASCTKRGCCTWME